MCLILAVIGGWRWQVGQGYGIWVLGIFAGLGAIFALALFKRCMWLGADDKGLTLHHWFSKATLPWSDIESLGLVYHHLFPSVGLCLTEAGKAKWPGRLYDREIMHVDAALPVWLAARADQVLARLKACQGETER
ncbi:hypothetical protein PVT67_07510 [Gallaecimonas kandeliae]|uniref:hypothetical protein n=1 Tax=Gallaecimonas kandeliae TaxID=3029055 RepID=UPI0026475D87|nr:hypothetical protein [Gallaecimonas kandeliae]WKE67076.1 hypothetical protein PVT67_07510 [Gallaecimonas kandeliae]